MNKNYSRILDSAAGLHIPDDLNLFPRVSARLTQRKTFMQTLRARPALAILLAILALILLTGVVYAIGNMLGYIPGLGIVEQNTPFRMLAEPVSVTRAGITLTVEQVFVDSQRTVIIYKTEGLSLAAANSKGEGGGNPFGSVQSLRLPDGKKFEEITDAGFSGTPEPIINNIKTEGGWPNYVRRLVYPSVSSQVNELTLVIPVLQNMPVGAAPENWEITFHLKPAPPEMTFAPVTVLPAVDKAVAATGEAGAPVLSNIAAQNGFTFQLDNVVELQDGFVFTGNMSWDNSFFPTGKGSIAEAVIPTLTDANGQIIPIEEVQVNGQHGENNAAWSYRTNRKDFVGPLTFSISSIKTSVTAPSIDFAIDLGSSLQIGQTAAINKDFVVNGHTVRLLSVVRGQIPATCQGVGIDFNFSADAPGIFAEVGDVLPSDPMVCSGGGGGGGGPVDPTVFSSAVSYRDVPAGLHHFSITISTPGVVNGAWQVKWNPPLASAPSPILQPGACLTLDKWNQLAGLNDALPSGLAGKILTTVDEGGLWPAIYVGALDGTVSTKVGTATWPSLSTDGARLAYSVGDGIHIHNLSSGENHPIGSDGYRIIWSPDDTRLMYTNTFNLFVINVDGSGLQKIDTGSAQVISPVGWLSDNHTIVYAAMGGDGFDLKSQDLQSAGKKALFTIHNKAGYGAISPDGQWIVFADRIFGANNWGIFISRLDGSERKLVAEPQVPTAFASVWGPDGQWLILNTQNADGTRLPVLVDPFTCQVARLNNINGMVEGWSP